MKWLRLLLINYCTNLAKYFYGAAGKNVFASVTFAIPFVNHFFIYSYIPGDVVMIQPHNSTESVNEFISHFSLNADQKIILRQTDPGEFHRNSTEFGRKERHEICLRLPVNIVLQTSRWFHYIQRCIQLYGTGSVETHVEMKVFQCNRSFQILAEELFLNLSNSHSFVAQLT